MDPKNESQTHNSLLAIAKAICTIGTGTPTDTPHKKKLTYRPFTVKLVTTSKTYIPFAPSLVHM